jgi:hypothetical protein
MVGIRAVLLLILLSLAAPHQARSAGAPGEAAVLPYPPALEEATRLAIETIRMNSSALLGDLISIVEPNMTCLECNCTYGYTSLMPLGDVQYSVNFLLSFVQSVTVTGSTALIRSSNNSIVVTTDRRLEAMSVRDIRSYDSFEIYLEDREAAEKVVRYLTTARDLCKK